MKIYNFLSSFISRNKCDPDNIDIMFKYSELKMMFYDPLDWIISSSNKYLSNKKFIKVIFS